MNEEKKGVFVTGVDTDIGKTVLSSLLLAGVKKCLGAAGYFKPVQAGPGDIAWMMTMLGQSVDYANSYSLKTPIAPNRAAMKENVHICLSRIQEDWTRLGTGFWVVEGAGGLLTPLNEKETIRDLLKTLRLPALLVSSTRLGTINHTLLTLESLHNAKIPVNALVLVGKKDEGLEETLKLYAKLPPVINVPFFENLSASLVESQGAEIFSDSILRKIFAEESGGIYER